MTHKLFKDSDLEAAYQAALLMSDPESRDLALRIIGQAAAEFGEADGARQLLPIIGPGIQSLWVFMHLYIDAGKTADYEVLKRCIEAVEDQDDPTGPTASDLYLYAEVIHSYYEGHLDQSRKLLAEIMDRTLKASALADLHKLTRVVDDLVPLMELGARAAADKPPSGTLQEVIGGVIQKKMISQIADDAMGTSRPAVQVRRERLLRFIALGAPDSMIRTELQLIVKTGDFETAEPYFKRFGCSKEEEEFRAAYAIGRAERLEIDEARQLARGLDDPSHRAEAYLTIYRAKRKAN